MPSTKTQPCKKKSKNMDLNAYFLAMALALSPSHRRNPRTPAEPEFKPFDLRYISDLAVNISQPRQICRQGKAQKNVPEALPA
jgi:hypothetical protein